MDDAEQRAARRAKLFRFTSPTMQRSEAHLNAKEALAFLQRFAPAHPAREVVETTVAGACFRRVTAGLAGAERKR